MNKLLLQKAHLPEVLDCSITTVKDLINGDQFPPPAGKLKSRHAWSVQDLMLWIEWGMPTKKEFLDRKNMLTKNKNRR